ncbi:MAG: hypothetical protein WD906_07710 [Anaerolineales bacterium]
MEPMVAILPVAAFLLGFCLILRKGWTEEPGDWRGAFVLASIGWGTTLALLNEVLSPVNGLTPPILAVLWLAAIVALGWAGRGAASIPLAWATLKGGLLSHSRSSKVFILGIALIATVLLAVAIISPPNTYDSAIYHMARVMHWQQDASLRPYPALFEHQLHKPIWAETAILHLRMLWGNDRPANLVQWFSMLGSVIVVSGIGRLLKAGRGGQVLAAACCVSIPMGVLQATSTQNDYVSAYWAACVAYLVVLGIRRRLQFWELTALSAATGLGALTKGTFFVYAPPFLAWFLLHELVVRGPGRAVRGALLLAGLAALINAGFWFRNIEVFGGPYGTSDWLQQNLWVRFLPNPSGAEEGIRDLDPSQALEAVPGFDPSGTPGANAGEGLRPSPVRSYIFRLLQTAGRNLTLPTGVLSRPVIDAVESMPHVFGETYADEMRFVSWNHEDFAGNPLHLLLVPVALVAVVMLWDRDKRKLALAYAGTTLLTYALIPIVISHGPSIFGIRYQLSFFVLWAPLVGVGFGHVRWEAVSRALTGVFLLAAIPFVLLNKTRPLVGMPPLRTSIGSILVEDQATILMPWNPDLRDDYLLTVQAIQASVCTNVALRAPSAFLEYPLWWLLDAPQNGTRMETFDMAPRLAPYEDPGFEPCAVICANCDDEQVIHGLPLFRVYDTLKLYMAK